MSTHSKFILPKTAHIEGFTLTIVWGGGMSHTKVCKGISHITGKPKYAVTKQQKLVQSIHNISATTIKHWLDNPINREVNNWKKKSVDERIYLHLCDYVADQTTRGYLLSWYV